jgi:L,D-transpeptidase YcbB
VGEAPPTSARDEISRLLGAGVASLGVADTSGADSTWAQVQEFYAQRGNRPVWTGRGPHRELKLLVQLFERADEAGLDPGDYGAPQLTWLLEQARRGGPSGRRIRPLVLGRVDVRATYGCLRMARHLSGGRVPRGILDPDWTPPSRALDWRETLKRCIDHPARTLAAVEPTHLGYRRLRDALALYRWVAAGGGWPDVPPGPPLGLGDRGPRVALLARRLEASGDLPFTMRDTVFDRRMVQAVGDYQSRLGIPRSGILGEASRAALNVPVETRIHQMELNLERWRWLPDQLGDQRVEINIPAYRLELKRGERVTRTMRVVVGRRRSPTPVFSDQLTYVELNPTWTLPPSVVIKEIVPALKREHDYLEKNHMFVVSIAGAQRDTVDVRKVPWKDAAADTFHYLVVQEAGPDNPLGRIKLMCPNEYDVYLHDTPQRSRFSVAVRDYSHGCVRVEEALELADSLVAGAPGDTALIDTLAVSGAWKRMRLRVPVPVHFMYWTAWADSAGRMNFRDDLYGLDARLDQALRRHDTEHFALNPGVELSPFWVAAEARMRAAAARLAAAKAARQVSARSP